MATINKKLLEEFVRRELKRNPELISEASAAGAFKWLKNMATGHGTLEKGGNLIFGRKKWEKGASKQFTAELDKVSNISVKSLIDQIKKEVSDYPNNTAGDDGGHQGFLAGTIEIGTLYDSLVAASKKYNPKAAKPIKGAMAPDVANGLVKALRMYVKVLMDRDLHDRYKHRLTEELRNSDELLIEEIQKQFEELEQIDELLGFGKKKKKYDKDDFLKVGDPGEEGETSASWKGLQSSILPLLLGAFGSGMISAHIIALNAIRPILYHPEGPIHGIKEVKKMIEEGGKALALEVQKGHGLEYMLRGAAQNAGLSPGQGVMGNVKVLSDHLNTDPHKFIDGLLDIQSGKTAAAKEMSVRAQHVVYDWVQQGGNETAFINPRGVGSAAKEFAMNSEYGGEDLVAALGEKAQTGGGVKGLGITLFGVAPNAVATITTKIVVPYITRKIIKTGVSAGATFAAQSSLGVLGATGLLGMIGAAAVTAGAAISLVRLKGRKSSRLQVLQDLYKTLAWIPGAELPPEKDEIDHPEKEDPDPEKEDPLTPEEIAEGARSCEEVLAKLEKLNLKPGDIVTLDRPASARVKWARKSRQNPDMPPLEGRRVMVTTVPGFKFLGENLLGEDELEEAWSPFKDKWAQKTQDIEDKERARRGDPGKDYVARKKSTDPGTDTGYAAGEVKLYDYESDPYAKQCEEHPWVIEVQFMTITPKGDPVFASPVVEVTKQDGKDRPRVGSGKLRDQMKETGEVPEGHKYEFLVKDHDSSDGAFTKFIEDFKAQLSPERAENFGKTIEQEMRKRRGMEHGKIAGRGELDPINMVPTGDEPKKRRRKTFAGREPINVPPESSPEGDAAAAAKRKSRRKRRRMREGKENMRLNVRRNKTFDRWSVIAGIGKKE